MRNLASLSRSCPQLLAKFRLVLPISGYLAKSIIKWNCYNSRTSDDTDMKLGWTTTYTMMTSKCFDNDTMLASCNIIAVFQFTTHLDQFGSLIRDAESIILVFLLITTVYLENRPRKSDIIGLKKCTMLI